MAGSTTNISIRMDSNLKAQADAFFGELGMNLSTAFNIFVRQSRYTKEFIDKTGHFSISFLGEEYRKALQHLGTVSGRDGDKISEAGVSVAYENGIPYIDEAELVLTCTALSATDITMDQMLDAEIEPKWYADGDLHTMYVGKIEEILVR